MIIICGKCHKKIIEKKPFEDQSIAYGICPHCITQIESAADFSEKYQWYKKKICWLIYYRLITLDGFTMQQIKCFAEALTIFIGMKSDAISQAIEKRNNKSKKT